MGLNLYGLSYHVERDRLEELGLDNEVNPGLGLRWRMPSRDPRWDWIAEGGIFHDSGRNTALYAGGGIFWHLTERLHLGGALALFYSDTYNGGNAFIAPIPLLAWDWRAATLNLAFSPKVHGVNDVNTFFLYLTFWPKRANR